MGQREKEEKKAREEEEERKKIEEEEKKRKAIANMSQHYGGYLNRADRRKGGRQTEREKKRKILADRRRPRSSMTGWPSSRPRSTTSRSSSRGKSTTSTNFVNGSTSSKAWAPRVKAAESAQSRPWPTSVLARTLSSKIKAKLLVTQ